MTFDNEIWNLSHIQSCLFLYTYILTPHSRPLGFPLFSLRADVILWECCAEGLLEKVDVVIQFRITNTSAIVHPKRFTTFGDLARVHGVMFVQVLVADVSAYPTAWQAKLGEASWERTLDLSCWLNPIALHRSERDGLIRSSYLFPSLIFLSFKNPPHRIPKDDIGPVEDYFPSGPPVWG